MSSKSSSVPLAESKAIFSTTHWSVVLEAGQPGSPGGLAALEKLCQAYWYPLYACVRRQGYDPHDACDLTQAFFARLLAKNSLRHADQTRGRFRTFLQTSLKNFLAKEWAKSVAEKRGGARVHFSLDAAEAEHRYLAEPADHLSPDRVFEQRWAARVLELVVQRLAEEYTAAGKEELFLALKDYVWGEGGSSYAEIGVKCAMSETAVKVAAHRMRERYRALLRAEVAQTVALPKDAEDELRHLLAVISG